MSYSTRPIDWVILTALGLEFKAVRAHLQRSKHVAHEKGTQYEIGEFPTVDRTLSVAVAECGAGNVGAAIEAERAISFFNCMNALFVGVAGGIKDVKLGDVVCGTRVYQYESGKAADTFLPRPQLFQSAYSLVQASRSVARNGQWQARVRLDDVGPAVSSAALVGPIAAGEKVVSSLRSPEYEFIRSTYSDALAVEMEGYGFLSAGYANAANCMVIRGISDLVEGKAAADTGGSQVKGSAAAAGFAFELIELLASQDRASVSDSDWQDLEKLAVSLYPLGPTDTQVWSRAGGDQSALLLGVPGVASWHHAIRLIRNGGGGQDITFNSLVSLFRSDHPNNAEVSKFFKQVE